MVNKASDTRGTSREGLANGSKAHSESNVFLNKLHKGEPEMETSHNTKTADNDTAMSLADIKTHLYEHKDTIAFEPEYNKFGERVGAWCYDTERPEIREFYCL